MHKVYYKYQSLDKEENFIDKMFKCNLKWKVEDHQNYSQVFKLTFFKFVCFLKNLEKSLHFKFGKFILIEIIKMVDIKSFLKYEFTQEMFELGEIGIDELNRLKKLKNSKKCLLF